MSFDLIHGDCGDILPTIDDKSVDAIICDLPYSLTDCKWDSEISSTWLFSEYFRITKKNAPIILFASQPFTSVLVYEHMKDFKYEWIWVKNAGSNFGTLKYNPMKEHESVLVFSNGGGKTTYNPIMQQRSESGLKRVKTIVNYNTTAEVYGKGKLVGDNKVSSKRPDLRYPSSVQYFNRERGYHPTQKPLDLLMYLVKTYTNEDELVLDNCMGSGTTGVACKNLNRKFIGTEKEKKHYDISVNRCKLLEKVLK